MIEGVDLPEEEEEIDPQYLGETDLQIERIDLDLLVRVRGLQGIEFQDRP